MVLSMERWEGKVAIVTGASSGIGLAIAEKLVEEGMVVVGLARRIDRLNEQEKKLNGKKGKFYGIKCDMSQEIDILNAFEEVAEKIGHVHVLVNNAGVAPKGNLSDGNTENWKSVLDVNVLGLCIATREAVKVMKTNNISGHVIHINSITGHFIPKIEGLNIYPASKHAVTAMTKVLRQEFADSKTPIKISSVSPGLVKTEIFETGGILSADAKEGMSALDSEDVADAVAYLLSTPPTVDVPELTIRMVNERI